MRLGGVRAAHPRLLHAQLAAPPLLRLHAAASRRLPPRPAAPGGGDHALPCPGGGRAVGGPARGDGAARAAVHPLRRCRTRRHRHRAVHARPLPPPPLHQQRVVRVHAGVHVPHLPQGSAPLPRQRHRPAAVRPLPLPQHEQGARVRGVRRRLPHAPPRDLRAVRSLPPRHDGAGAARHARPGPHALVHACPRSAPHRPQRHGELLGQAAGHEEGHDPARDAGQQHLDEAHRRHEGVPARAGEQCRRPRHAHAVRVLPRGRRAQPVGGRALPCACGADRRGAQGTHDARWQDAARRNLVRHRRGARRVQHRQQRRCERAPRELDAGALLEVHPRAVPAHRLLHHRHVRRRHDAHRVPGERHQPRALALRRAHAGAEDHRALQRPAEPGVVQHADAARCGGDAAPVVRGHPHAPQQAHVGLSPRTRPVGARGRRGLRRAHAVPGHVVPRRPRHHRRVHAVQHTVPHGRGRHVQQPRAQ
eukprot:PhM_4_TR8455/c0_g1_i1/m.1865